MQKISIVLTYYQRLRQLLNTLESFKQYNPDDFNVIIVDDDSPDDIILAEYPYDITLLKVKDKTWINPGPAYNVGFKEAINNGAENIIIQNAECYHCGDIISAVKKNITEKKYLSFGCYALSKDQDINFKALNMRTATCNGDSAWYNHSRYRPEALHFCSALTVGNLKKLNGFDERFAFGIGFDDNYFIHQVKTLGLQVQFIDDPYVFHQYHYDVRSSPHVEEKYLANSNTCIQLRKRFEFRAKHLLTPDL
jgi:glycosyltransferase involved in cell wall biosynthesis